MPYDEAPKRRRKRSTLLVAGLGAAVALIGTASAVAAEPNQVVDLTVRQGDGYATLAWTTVPGVTDYQIERTPVDASNVPTGAAVVVGVWQPARQVNNAFPTFADAGFALGNRFQWRVRARIGTTAQPYSDPVFGTTNPQWGTGPGADMRTQWESSGNATYTSDVNEYSYEAAVDAASDRVRVVEIGRTNPIASGTGAPGNRPINMFIIHYPSAPLTAEQISNMPTVAVNCSVHGDEPQGREACLIAARELAFTTDPHLVDILSNTVVLITPTINQNGRARNTRGNETGADLNRDHAELLQPETKAYAAMLRDYTPEVGMDLHEGDNEDLPILSARHLNVYEPLFLEGKNGLIEGWMYNHAAQDGMWTGPYSSGGDSHEGILRNTFSLKNAVGMLNESRSTGGATRPAEGTQLANRNRKSYFGLWEIFQTIEYYHQRRAIIHQAVEESKAWNSANVPPLRPFWDATTTQTFAVGKLVTRGSYPWPNFPPVGTGTNGPDTDAITLPRTLVEQPCGYFLTNGQYGDPHPEGTVGLRLDLHGVKQESRPSGHIVRLAQPLRGLLPTILDAAAVSPDPIVAGTRLFECPYVTAAPRSWTNTLLEGKTTTGTLAMGNIAPEVDEPLNWTITEAATDCASPSDLPWVSADVTHGSLASQGGSRNVTLTFSSVGVSGPATLTGVICLASNDAGEALITMPVSLTVRSLRAEIGDVRASLAARSPLPVTHDNKALTAALAALATATDAANWSDGVRPTAGGGRTVFDALVRAAKELNKIDQPWAASAVDTLVARGREIAATALDEAPAGPNKQKGLLELARGDAMVNAETKLESYRRAWAWVGEA